MTFTKSQPSAKLIRTLLRWLTLAMLLASAQAFAQSTGTVTYVYTDAQGTPLAETDASGNITATFDYTPYGTSALGTPPNGPGYTGHVNDPETNLVYMQARYYDSVTGHFLSIDPVALKVGDTSNFNRYSYVEDNPITGVDPTGKFADGLTGNQISCEVYTHSGCGTSNSGGGDTSNSASNLVLGSSSTNQATNNSGGNIVNQFDVGRDAHSTLQGIALASSPFYFAENYRDPNGIFFGGRPDLGNVDLHSLWEIKPLGGSSSGIAQLMGYIAFSGFTYAPGKLPGFFMGSNTLTAQGAFATYTYNYTPTGVIYYTYQLKQNYQYRYNFFPRVNASAVGAAAVMDVIRGIVTTPGALPVPVP